MVHRHLISCGYFDAAGAMERECNVELAKWELADNIDLNYVVQDFEDYFEIKFQKKPVLCKKNPLYLEDVPGRRVPNARNPLLPSGKLGSAKGAKHPTSGSNVGGSGNSQRKSMGGQLERKVTGADTP